MPVTAVHIHYLDADRAKTPERVDTFVVGKRQLRAVRRPGGVVLLRQRVGQLRLVGTVRVDHPDVVLPRPHDEGDPTSIRRPGGKRSQARVVDAKVGQRPKVAAVKVHHVEVHRVIDPRPREGDAIAVG